MRPQGKLLEEEIERRVQEEEATEDRFEDAIGEVSPPPLARPARIMLCSSPACWGAAALSLAGTGCRIPARC